MGSSGSTRITFFKIHVPEPFAKSLYEVSGPPLCPKANAWWITPPEGDVWVLTDCSTEFADWVIATFKTVSPASCSPFI